MSFSINDMMIKLGEKLNFITYNTICENFICNECKIIKEETFEIFFPNFNTIICKDCIKKLLINTNY